MHRQLVNTEFGQVHMRVEGEPAAEGILYIHQTPSSSRMWQPVMALMPDEFAVAPDIIGLGMSDEPRRALSIAEYAKAVRDAANATGCSRWWVVGHHTGAALAAQVACDYPDETLGLMVSGYPLYRDWRHRYSRIQLCRDDEISPEGSELAVAWQNMWSFWSPEAPYGPRRAAFVDKLMAGELWYLPYVALFTTDTEQLLERARKDTRPTVVLAGDEDSMSAASDRVADILGVPPTRVTGTSWWPVEHPDVFAAAIRSWRQQ